MKEPEFELKVEIEVGPDEGFQDLLESFEVVMTDMAIAPLVDEGTYEVILRKIESKP